MAGESKTSPRRISARERQAKALELRKYGYTYEHIAKELGWKSKQAAEWAVKAALSRITDPLAAEVKKLDLERLDHMLLKLKPSINKGYPKAIYAAISILKHRANLLGLNAPIEENVTVRDGDKLDLSKAEKAELEAALAEVEKICGVS